jgi:hypothetical protein
LTDTWQVRLDPADERILVSFSGHLSGAEGGRSAAALVSFMADRELDLVLDVHRMTGYDRAARKSWEKALWPRRRNIRHMTVLGGSAVVKLGAMMLGAALGVRVTSTDGASSAPREDSVMRTSFEAEPAMVGAGDAAAPSEIDGAGDGGSRDPPD